MVVCCNILFLYCQTLCLLLCLLFIYLCNNSKIESCYNPLLLPKVSDLRWPTRLAWCWWASTSVVKGAWPCPCAPAVPVLGHSCSRLQWSRRSSGTASFPVWWSWEPSWATLSLPVFLWNPSKAEVWRKLRLYRYGIYDVVDV